MGLGVTIVAAGGLAVTPVDFSGALMNLGAILSGATAQRPAVAVGQSAFYLDTTLGKMLYWGGAHWFDLTGTQVADYVPPGTVPNDIVTSEDGNFYLTTEDGLYYLQQQAA